VLWEKDGRESSVAVVATSDLAFFVNGKSDGAARWDAETQVMTGLLGGMLHPNPRTSLVVGLGTGSTAGWLGLIPSMQRVDAIELEPVILDVARACAPVNAGVMTNKKVHITIGDAREVLLASDRTYDLIASEPSNPYRAGVASLFTREFYEAAERRLAPGGYVMQWVQAYAMHGTTMRTIYATLNAVFPHVQTWWTSRGDFLLIASREPIAIDAPALRAKLTTEPYRSALHNVWRADTLEQFLGRMVANEDYARLAAKQTGDLNTDDRTVVEFGFARSIDASATLLGQIAQEGETMKLNRPVALRNGANVNWSLVDANRLLHLGQAPRPLNLGQVAQGAMKRLESGNLQVEDHIALLRPREPIEADVILAGLRMRQGQMDEAAQVMHRALVAFRDDPWPDPELMAQGVTLAVQIGGTSPARARLIHDAMSKPFSVLQQENYRRYALIELAPLFDGCGPKTLSALQDIEPHPYWTKEVLSLRADCYSRAKLDLASRALRDLESFEASTPEAVVTPPAPPAPRGSS
jgi:spermidine synthase